MLRPPPRPNRTDTPCPYTTLFRSERGGIAFLVLVLGRKHLAEIQGKDKQAGVAALLLNARVGAGCIAGRFHGPAQFLLAEIGNRPSSRFLAHKLLDIAPE